MGLSDLAKTLSKLGQDTKNGVQKMSDSVSISNRISQEKKSLERLFALIGEAVYKEHPDQPKAGLEDEWAAVKVAYANIAAYTDQLNHMKGIVYCPNCSRPAASGDKYCARCGFRLEVRPERTGLRIAMDVKEVGQEVGHMAGSAKDKTGEAVGGAAAGTHNAFFLLKQKFVKSKKNTEGKTPEASEQGASGSGSKADEEGRDPGLQTDGAAAEGAAKAGSTAAEGAAGAGSTAAEGAAGAGSTAAEGAAGADSTAAEGAAGAGSTAAERTTEAGGTPAGPAEDSSVRRSGSEGMTEMWRRRNVQIPKKPAETDPEARK